MTDVTTEYRVSGLTCEHCVNAVSTELRALPDVSGVEVTLVAGGLSTVKVASAHPLDRQAVADAVDEAGDYALADA